MNKHGRHDQADYVIKPKRGRSLWDLNSTIMLKFGVDAINGFCCIEARKLVVEEKKIGDVSKNNMCSPRVNSWGPT